MIIKCVQSVKRPCGLWKDGQFRQLLLVESGLAAAPLVLGAGIKWHMNTIIGAIFQTSSTSTAQKRIQECGNKTGPYVNFWFQNVNDLDQKELHRRLAFVLSRVLFKRCLWRLNTCPEKCLIKQVCGMVQHIEDTNYYWTRCGVGPLDEDVEGRPLGSGRTSFFWIRTDPTNRFHRDRRFFRPVSASVQELPLPARVRER